MSYARFLDSDVYVYLDVRGFLCCCACRLNGAWEYDTTADMLAHLNEHEAAGHDVPDRCREGLNEDQARNDAFIARLAAEKQEASG